MDDMVSRQAAIDHWRDIIDATDESDKYNMGFVDGLEFCISHLSTMPPAQPEIVRCKDCKWYGRADKRRFYRGMDCLQKRIDTIIPDKDFCSRAERREE